MEILGAMSRASRWSAPLALVLSVVCLAGCKKPSEAEPGEAAPRGTEVAAETTAKPAPLGLSKTEPKPASPSQADDESEPSERRDATAERSAGDEKPGRRRASSRKAERSVRSEGASTARESQDTEDEGDDDEKAPVDVPLSVKRIQFSETIAGREPVSPEETFGAGDTKSLYAFVELSNPTAQASKIIVTFVPPQGASTKVTLKVGEVSRWRTWALRKKPTAVGTWNVVVSNVDGKELARRSFEVTE